MPDCLLPCFYLSFLPKERVLISGIRISVLKLVKQMKINIKDNVMSKDQSIKRDSKKKAVKTKKEKKAAKRDKKNEKGSSGLPINQLRN